MFKTIATPFDEIRNGSSEESVRYLHRDEAMSSPRSMANQIEETEGIKARRCLHSNPLPCPTKVSAPGSEKLVIVELFPKSYFGLGEQMIACLQK